MYREIPRTVDLIVKLYISNESEVETVSSFPASPKLTDLQEIMNLSIVI